MSSASPNFVSGQRVSHPEMGAGVLISCDPNGYARVMFQSTGERQVPITSLQQAMSWDESVVSNIGPVTSDGFRRLKLAIEATQLPLMESAATLTAAKVDLLPHQIVLVHKISNASPRRYLIADSVGLGKTIETALILRELASRGELKRALMIVPAGLVENWRRELNETFSLDFEVFGAQGDVTDRKSNAFAKHNRMIASIDTLKRPARVKNLLNAPPWDLIVFDEAHHLTAYRTGNRVKKTLNFKLGEALVEHSRDMMLLSATPHQGDHFRFWMLVRLLHPTLFMNTQDMLDNRFRLNSVVFRRTQADACDANGDPLFARRQVHTTAFQLTDAERRFYEALLEYLRDGYNLAKMYGNEGRALGFIMTIFQKIAASSFAAVSATLRRRLLSLTVHESIVCDENLDVDGRQRAMENARGYICEMYNLSNDPIGSAEADRILADAKVKLLRKLGQKVDSPSNTSEQEALVEEDTAAMLVSMALPEERQRIRDLLQLIPEGEESKTKELIQALGELWKVHPDEKIVVFTTYLGSLAALRDAIDHHFPEAGVEILKGGDHGAKTAAEKRFKKPDGPRVLICTAAGREGINLQFARVLFNHDLPWNPMDVEQRIGRIHRYGQKHTAQVYNLVSAETIEGQIFMLLEEKLLEIAKALGKVDAHGQVAEDLRGQILGHLSEKISYDKLYQEAVADPTLVRTKEELEVAITNAKTAREVVWELFQDLDDFGLDDYQQFDDKGEGMNRLLQFVSDAVRDQGGEISDTKEPEFSLSYNAFNNLPFTADRDRANSHESLNLLGLEHPAVRELLVEYNDLDSDARGFYGSDQDGQMKGVLTYWWIQIHGSDNHYQQMVLPIGISEDGSRNPMLESKRAAKVVLERSPDPLLNDEARRSLLKSSFPSIIQNDLEHRGLLTNGATYTSKLLGWLEFA